MEIVYGLDGLGQLPPGAVLSIGNFDGMHRGHHWIIENCKSLAVGNPGGAAVPVAVATFEPHPLTVLRPELAPPRLTPALIKQQLLAAAGVDYLVILPPDPLVLNLSAEQFWELVRDQVRPISLVEGDGFFFGKGRGGDIHKLRQWSAGTAVGLRVVQPLQMPLLDLAIVRVSSSLIRYLVSEGRIRDAAICLGRPYLLEGQVIKGRQVGRTIGVPTANLDCGQQLVPADGVYCGRSRVGGTVYPAAISIGPMPTFEENKRQIEVHLLGFNGDIYGQALQVDFLDWIRDQRKFPNVEVLKVQMARDIALAGRLVALDPARPIARLDIAG